MNLPTLFKRRRTVEKAGLPFSGVGSGWQTLFRFTNRETFPGSWQKSIPIDNDSMMRHHAVFSAMSQIASDLAKMRMILRQQNTSAGYWAETQNPAYSPVLARPNYYQNAGQFIESWAWSKLSTGNFYALKVRDNRNVVVGLWPLDPYRVKPLVSTDGSAQVFYQLNNDNMTLGLESAIVVPAREVLHDRFNTIHHPLVGVSPLYACATAASAGLAMGNGAARFFARGASTSGVLTAPGAIDPDTAKRLEDKWQDEFAGSENSGKIAVLGSGLKFESMQMSMVDAQICELMKWSATEICSVFHMPAWKIGLDVWPRGVVQVSALAIDYLVSCLQSYVESIERVLTDGLGLPSGLKAGLDETGLLRMDPVSLGTYLGDLVARGVMCPNEARAKLGLPPVAGGDSCYMQQQNYSLSALAARDAAGPAPSSSAPAQTLMLPNGQNIDIGAEVRRHLPRAPDVRQIESQVARLTAELEATRGEIHKSRTEISAEINAERRDVEAEIEALGKYIENLRAGAIDTYEEKDAHGRVVSTTTRRTNYGGG